MLKKLLSYRLVNIYAAIFILVILAIAGYAQFHDKLVPCPLCIMQRMAFMVLLMLFIAAALYIPGHKARKYYQSFMIVIAGFGIAFASRHIYIQHMPVGSRPSCGPGFNFIIKNLPPKDALHMLFFGSGECAKINWHFLGLSMPEWSLICFIILVIICLKQIFRQKI